MLLILIRLLMKMLLRISFCILHQMIILSYVYSILSFVFALLRLLRMKLLRIPKRSSGHPLYLYRTPRSSLLGMTSQRQSPGPSWRSKTMTRGNPRQHFTHLPHSLLTPLALGSSLTVSQPPWNSHVMYSSR